MQNTNLATKDTNKLGLSDIIERFNTKSDPRLSLELALKEMADLKVGESLLPDKCPNLHNIFMTLEFEKGTLLSVCFPASYDTFAIDFSRKLQKEFDCQTPHEKSLAELTALNFCRTLFIQRKINGYLEKGTVTDIGVNYLNFLSKDLDRANRHYLASLQGLKTMRQPNIEVNIRTNTAVVGENQVVQTNNK